MKHPNEQEKDSGQSKEKSGMQLLQESPTPKIKSKKRKEKAISPSKTGSEKLESQERTSDTSEIGRKNGSVLTKKSKMPVPKLTVKVDRKSQALARIGVSPETLETAPQITPTIKSSVKGGLKSALDAMRFSNDDPDISAFLEKYDSIPVGDRSVLPWEAIALSSSVNPKHLIGAIFVAVASLGATKSKFIIASNHPSITRARVRFGQMPNGERDRTALDIMAGAQQSPKGLTFIGTAHFGASNAANSKVADVEDTVDAEVSQDDQIDQLFPSVVGIQEKLIPIRQKLLEGNKE